MVERKKRAVKRRTQQERTDATRTAVLDAAEKLFAARGFAQTSIEDILAAADVTRGALYHHFDSKTAVFRAVFEAREEKLTSDVARSAAGKTNAWERLRAGCHGFLEACLDPAMQRIILIDAPAVIGWEAMREIEARYALALLKAGLENARKEGALASRSVDMLATFLLGALQECGMAIARAPNPAEAMKQAKRELDLVLGGLRAPA